MPDGSTSNDDVLNLDEIGNYSILITAENGCTETFNFEVKDLSYDPSLQLEEDRIWRCNDTEVNLDLIYGKYVTIDIHAHLSNNVQFFFFGRNTGVREICFRG